MGVTCRRHAYRGGIPFVAFVLDPELAEGGEKYPISMSISISISLKATLLKPKDTGLILQHWTSFDMRLNVFVNLLSRRKQA